MPTQKTVYYPDNGIEGPFETEEECLVYEAIIRAKLNPESRYFGPGVPTPLDMIHDIARELYRK